ncbi:MAG TPA: SDR family NAD(P)-dependent oxidoreductase, partial [Burkholderiales bacterium]|nr:SDR family NAD(P)-dependent oxidoreductase [Burkholderiales bacterium]
MSNPNPLALIVGAGSGLSASLARKCAASGMRVVLAARQVGKLDALAAETQARAFACDAADPIQVQALFAAIDTPDLVVYNPSYRVRGPFLQLDLGEVQKTLLVTAYGG